jgi:class 3 adenylate cyclase
MGEGDVITRARDAADRGRWADALALLTDADGMGGLDADDLDRLAWAAFFAGSAEASANARQRAFAAFVARGDRSRAGLAALHVAMSHYGRGAAAVAGGWFEHAEHYLGGDTDCDEHAWLVWARAVIGAEEGDAATSAIEKADHVIATGRRVGSRDVEALGQLLKAQLLIRVGEVADGTRLLDQVMALAVGGCLGSFATAWLYCGTISTCATAGDYQRAWEWTTEVGRCAVQPGLNDFPGDCRLHRAEMLRLRGQWSEAEFEVASICDELASWHVGHVGIAYSELGELCLRKGDLEGADEAFRQATELGMSPQPGVTALHLLRGEVEMASSAIGEALAAAHDDRCQQARLLPAAVDVALAKADIEHARVCVDSLAALTLVYSSPPQRARAAHAAGALALAAGDVTAARTALAEAVRLWDSAHAPYESARSRVTLAAAHLAAGDAAANVAHLNAALQTFERLGAVLDAHHVADLLGHPVHSTKVGRALMFTDVEQSTNLLALLGDDAWIELLRWHDGVLRQAFERHRGLEVHQKGGGDGFFVAFTSPAAGLDCALDIQQSLRTSDEDRLAVRIGVHWADVLQAGGDFSGRGVHEAARISALAKGGEILTSVVTLRATAKEYRFGDLRRVELRGLPGEVEVASIRGGGDTSDS